LKSRREFLQSTSRAVVFAAMSRVRRAFAAGNVRVGAIRWDAWYGGDEGSSSWFASHNLDPSKYHSRAPFFAKETGPESMSIHGDQRAMDAEIEYAHRAGLSFWAFDGSVAATSSLAQGFRLYASSSFKHLVNWCWVYGYRSFQNDVDKYSADIVRRFSDVEYEKISARRPLLFLLPEVGVVEREVAQSVSRLRDFCSSAGIGNPYVVTMGGTAQSAKAHRAAVNADAIGSYTIATSAKRGPYPVLDKAVRMEWERMAQTGLSVVPTGMLGFDRRPRIQHPVPWEPDQKPFDGMSDYFEKASPEEVSAHTEALIKWVMANRRSAQANVALLYAWDEFDEGGWLCPTWLRNGADTSRLDALSPVLNAHR